MDLYARRVIAHKVGYSNNTHLVKETFRMAYESRKPEPGLIFHTDQGGNYRSRAFGDYLKARAVTQSFSKPGVPYDNSVMETFFASMKREELYRYKYRSEREFRAAVDNQLKEHVEKLEGIITILKIAGCTVDAPLDVKLSVLERLYHEEEYSVRMLCEALEVPRGTFYNHLRRNKRDNTVYAKRKEELTLLL